VLLKYAPLDVVGQFTAAIQLSTILLSLLNAPLAVYHLPMLSAATAPGERQRVLRQLLSFSCLVGSCAVIVALAAKALIIHLLYSGRFVGALPFLDWFFPAIFFQSLLWILGLALIALRRGGRLFVLDLFQYVLFAPLAILAVGELGRVDLLGPFYFLAQLIALAVSAVLLDRLLGGAIRHPPLLLRGGLSSAAVLGMMVLTLGHQSVSWSLLAFSIVVAGTLFFLLATSDERRAVASILFRRR
jgi:O-antigen/teichoic acid export membrane protein